MRTDADKDRLARGVLATFNEITASRA